MAAKLNSEQHSHLPELRAFGRAQDALFADESTVLFSGELALAPAAPLVAPRADEQKQFRGNLGRRDDAKPKDRMEVPSSNQLAYHCP